MGEGGGREGGKGGIFMLKAVVMSKVVMITIMPLLRKEGRKEKKKGMWLSD